MNAGCMKYLPLLLITLSLTACAAGEDYHGPTRAQDKLVQPGRVTGDSTNDQAYWDALDNVPGARTGEADYYYSHRGGGGHP